MQKLNVKKKKKSKTIRINPIYSYADNHIWSQRYKLWTRYHVNKPRLPTQADVENRWVELPENCPKTFGGFVGRHNAPAFTALNNIFDKYSNTMMLPEVTTIYGAKGTGKSAIAKVFVAKLIDEQNLSDIQASKWCMAVDAKHYSKDINTMNNLWTKINKFAEPALERFLKTRFRLVVIDNFDAVGASAQQVLKRLMEAHAQSLRFILVCADPRNCMIGFILTRSTNVKTRPISERDALQVILSFCSAHFIGYELDGIHEIFKLNPTMAMSSIMDMIQATFVTKHYISQAFVQKVQKVPAELPEVSERRSIEPFDRCQLCTLMPPCQHITIDDLNQMGVARRKELPRYKKGSMNCPEFSRFGYCTMFNKTGHCSLDHPKNLHKVTLPPPRCPRCTIIWPCDHCDYTPYRKHLLDTIAVIQQRISRMRSINVPEPAMSLVRHLESDPNWQNKLRRIEHDCFTPQNIALLDATIRWVETGYAVSIQEYEDMEAKLINSFGDLYSTPILLDPAAAMAALIAKSTGAAAAIAATAGAGGSGAVGTGPKTLASRLQGQK